MTTPQSDPVSGSPAVTPEAVKRATRALRELGWDGIGIEGDVADALAAAHPEPMVPASKLHGLHSAIDELRMALKVASDDLFKAANQFAGLRASQQAGTNWPISGNPELFEAKAERARAALDAHKGGRR